MAVPAKLRSRYELREAISRGGMGVIYRAYDTVMKREVAVKTVVDVDGPAAVEMFHKEWGLQASVIHPNVVEIYDIGDFEEDGALKPYFVMPLLPGLTLGRLIKGSSRRLTVERAIDIICQTCRGLQAAHERGLVHRDLKPGNIFVMDDDSVKIIDFGLVHNENGKSTVGVKGTLPYMAPELLQMKPPSVLTDIFALGAVCYEILTLRRAFEGSSDIEISKAILHQNPPPVNEINKGANELIGRVVHKAMAKHPWHRFSSAREFGETLQKALHNEPIEFFDPVRVLTRVDRAEKAFGRGQYQVATEILGELEGEGHIDREITHLRRRIDQSIRQNNSLELLKSARQFLDEEEYALSLRKIQEALQIDASDESALALQDEVASGCREKKIKEASQLAIRHLENNAFTQARGTILSLLDLEPAHAEGLEMLAEVDRRESEYVRVREQKREIYDQAVEAWQRGEVAAALTGMERWMLVDRETPESDGKRLSRQNFYNQVHSEHEAIKNSYEEAGRLFRKQSFPAALALCEQYLCKYPRHALFRTLKVDIEEGQRQSIASVIAEPDSIIESEAAPRCASEPAPKARLEVPADIEPAELEMLPEPLTETAATVMTHLSQGATQGCFEEDLDAMRRAYAISDEDTLLRAALSDALGARALTVMDSDLPAAERIIGELLDLDPDHAAGQKLYAQVLDKKRDDFLSWCTTEALQLQAAGDLQRARTVAQQGLTWHRQDPGLNQLLAALDSAIQHLEAPQSNPAPAELPADSTPGPLAESVSAVPAPPATIDQPRNKVRAPILLGLSCAIVALLGAGVYRMARGRNPAVAPVTTVQVELRTNPPGAILKIDGKVRGSSNLQLDLIPGVHTVTAELEGYQPTSATVTPRLGQRAAGLDLVLLPLPVTLRVYSDAEGTEAWLDEKPLTIIREGELLADTLPSGTHSFRFSNRKGRVSMGLDLAAGKSPMIGAPKETKGIEVALVKQYASHIWVYCNCSPIKVSLDNQAPEKLGSSGVDWTGVIAGPHELRVNDGKSKRTFKIQSGPAPSVTAFVFSKAEPDTGVLSISTGEDNVKVYLNNNLYRRTTQEGHLRIPDLAVKQPYNVWVSKEGYEGSPAQTVSLTAGAETNVTFQLKAAVRMATLQIKGGQSGARVLVDEKPIGGIAPDGAFLGEVTPGSHSIELRKDALKSKKVTRSFAEGRNTVILGPDLIVESVPGTMRFKVSPPNSNITVRRAGERDSQARPISQESAVLPEGSYIVSASAPGHVNSVASVALQPGGDVLVEIALKRIESARETSSVGTGAMANWEDPGSWTQDGQSFIHKSGGFVPYRGSPVYGSFTFEATVLKGKRLQWAVNRTDDKNYILFKLDRKYFERSEVENGRSKDQVKIEHDLTDKLSFSLKIDISADRIQHSLIRSGNWVVIDSWSPRGGFDKGKFGFIIPWRDEFAVTSFIFSPHLENDK